MPARDLRERTFEFSCAVVRFCRELSTEPGVVRQIAWQLADAATSAGSNLEEAKAAYSRREFAAKNSISLKEMRETRYWLRLILHCDLAAAQSVQPLLAEANELTAMLTTGMRRLHPVLTTLIVGVLVILALPALFWFLRFQFHF